MKSIEIPLINKLNLTEAVSEVDMGLIDLFESQFSEAFGLDKQRLVFVYHDLINSNYLKSIIKMTALTQEILKCPTKINLNILAIHLNFSNRLNVEIHLNEKLNTIEIEDLVQVRQNLKLLNLKYSQISQKIIMSQNEFVESISNSQTPRIENEL